jgi:hypothetical protein
MPTGAEDSRGTALARSRASLPVLLAGGLAYVLHDRAFALYRQLVQEDALLEWATFWLLLLAAWNFAGLALALRRRFERFPLAAALLALFCVFVAMEEISWGQRIFNFDATPELLAINSQREFNIHNTFGADARQLILNLFLLGYGVVAPLLADFVRLPALLAAEARALPPPALVPAFVATAFLLNLDPWGYTTEICELMLAMALALVAVARRAEFAERPAVARGAGRGWKTVALALVVAWASEQLSWRLAGAGEDFEARAREELEVLAGDLGRALENSGDLETGDCGLHGRVASLVGEPGWEALADGSFAAMAGRELPETRARFFVDPWNQPYWYIDVCRVEGPVFEREARVYSFGRNRRRDSVEFAVAGDDLAVVVRKVERRRPAPPSS